MGRAESREAEPGPEPEPIAPPTTDDNLARHLPRTSSYDQAMTAAMIPGDSPAYVEANLMHEVCTTILAGNMGMGHGALPLLCLLHGVSPETLSSIFPRTNTRPIVPCRARVVADHKL